MIQPIKAERNTWRVSWVDLEDPLPCVENDTDPADRAPRFFLPTVVLIQGRNGKLVDHPRLLEELDQSQIESYLENLFGQHGQPECLAVESSGDWEEKAWQRFSRDFRIEIQFTEHRKKAPSAKQELAANLAKSLLKEQKQTSLSPAQVAVGLVKTAHRMRSQEKRVALFRKALALDSACAYAQVELGDLEFQQGNWSTALRNYEEVIGREIQRLGRGATWADEANRPYLRSRLGRAMVLWQYGKYAEAAGECECLLEGNPLDNQGARFFLPMLYLLAEEPEKANAFFHRYPQIYPRDYQEPSFLFGWGLVLSLHDEENAAKIRYKEGILKNFYIPSLLLEQSIPPLDIWLPNDRADFTYAQEFMDSYAMLWDRDTGALRLLREAYAEILPRVKKLIVHRQAMTEFQDQRYDPEYREKWQKLLSEDETLVKLG